jgi:hypothetical protein
VKFQVDLGQLVDFVVGAWGEVSGVLAVVAFLGLVWMTLRRRIIWLWTPAYLIYYMDFHKEGGFKITLLCRNTSNATKFITYISIMATVRGTGREYNKSWHALYIPETVQDATFVVPQGDSYHRVHLTLEEVSKDVTSPLEILTFSYSARKDIERKNT